MNTTELEGTACGACGEWINESETHNCSEEPRLAECTNCLTDFDPFKEGKVSDSPNLGGIVAFCGKCWKLEFTRRNEGK